MTTNEPLRTPAQINTKTKTIRERERKKRTNSVATHRSLVVLG